MYSNKLKTNGVDGVDNATKEKIYQQYLQAYKKGVFNLLPLANSPILETSK